MAVTYRVRRATNAMTPVAPTAAASQISTSLGLSPLAGAGRADGEAAAFERGDAEVDGRVDGSAAAGRATR